jgi:hypothetical protein
MTQRVPTLFDLCNPINIDNLGVPTQIFATCSLNGKVYIRIRGDALECWYLKTGELTTESPIIYSQNWPVERDSRVDTNSLLELFTVLHPVVKMAIALDEAGTEIPDFGAVPGSITDYGRKTRKRQRVSAAQAEVDRFHAEDEAAILGPKEPRDIGQ